MTHIDPFAPGDSPQHPSNWREEPLSPHVVDVQADLYQWRRDHLVMASEAGMDVAPEELGARHERYVEALELLGSPDERRDDAEFIAYPVLLRRYVLLEHDDEEHEEWTRLFDLHSTDGERDPMWVEGVLPDLAELRARAAVAAASVAAADVTQTGTPVPEILLTVPKGTALKEDWVAYALAVEKARGGSLTFEEADAMTVAALKDAYKPQVS